MAITEQQRFELHLELRKHLGDDVANTLMEHLPPSGWSDVVRLKDFEALERRLDMRIDGLDTRLGWLEKRMDGLEQRIDALDTKISRSAFGLATLVVGAAIPLLVLLLQIKSSTR